MTLVLDTSVLIAILANEPDAAGYAAAIEAADDVRISALTVFELFVVSLGKRGLPGTLEARALLATSEATLMPFDAIAIEAATAAYARYGKGIHPRARLNLADCAGYALATTPDAPLLFKGDDFSHTDVRPAA